VRGLFWAKSDRCSSHGREFINDRTYDLTCLRAYYHRMAHCVRPAFLSWGTRGQEKNLVIRFTPEKRMHKNLPEQFRQEPASGIRDTFRTIVANLFDGFLWQGNGCDYHDTQFDSDFAKRLIGRMLHVYYFDATRIWQIWTTSIKMDWPLWMASTNILHHSRLLGRSANETDEIYRWQFLFFISSKCKNEFRRVRYFYCEICSDIWKLKIFGDMFRLNGLKTFQISTMNRDGVDSFDSEQAKFT
jgi:hypothetical protein